MNKPDTPILTLREQERAHRMSRIKFLLLIATLWFLLGLTWGAIGMKFLIKRGYVDVSCTTDTECERMHPDPQPTDKRRIIYV